MDNIINKILKDLYSIDNDLSLAMQKDFDNGIISLAIYSKTLGCEMYQISSVNETDAFDSIFNFIECLNNSSKFIEYVEKVKTESLV